MRPSRYVSFRRHRYALRGAAGHSLVEAVVATALIVSVLIPLGGFAMYLLSVRRNEAYAEALVVGQRVMEETISAERYQPRRVRRAEGRWQIEHVVTRQGGQAHLVVRVFRMKRRAPLAELATVRLLP